MTDLEKFEIPTKMVTCVSCCIGDQSNKVNFIEGNEEVKTMTDLDKLKKVLDEIGVPYQLYDKPDYLWYRIFEGIKLDVMFDEDGVIMR